MAIPAPVRRVALTVVLTAASALPAQAPDPRLVSQEQFRDEVVRLQRLVAVCQSGAHACDPDQVGPDEQVAAVAPDAVMGRGGSDPSGFTMHWQWLRDALRTAPEPARQRQLSIAAARLNEIARQIAPGAAENQNSAGPQHLAQARAVVRSVLAQREFRDVQEPTWWDRLTSRLLQLLALLFGGVGRLGKAAPWLGRVLEWLLFTGAAAALLAVLLRNVARQRIRIAVGGRVVQPSGWPIAATDWAQRAEQHAGAGEWRDAVHCLYWAAIVLLESQRAWRHNPTRTPREYVALLQSGSARQAALGGLTQLFERVWYGLQPAQAEEYARARGLYVALEEGAANLSTRRSGAADAEGLA